MIVPSECERSSGSDAPSGKVSASHPPYFALKRGGLETLLVKQATASADKTRVGRWWIVGGVVGALLLSGCGASVSVSAGVITNDGSYLAAWRTGWTAVERASAPYVPTATSPGACNKGATKEACYETDLHVAQAIGRLGESLSHVSVPAAYKTANAKMLQAIRIDLHGLSLRMHSLEAGDYTQAERDRWFTESKALIAESHEVAQKAYQSFPQWARPNPAPII